MVFSIPADTSALPEAVPREPLAADGMRQGVNTSRFTGYRGPGPPKGQTHGYIFTLYALDTGLGLADGTDAAALEAAMRGHILATAELTGNYGR